MKHRSALLYVLPVLALHFLVAAPARANVEEEYNPDRLITRTPWLAKVTPESKAADLAFIDGMKPHHEGALTMSQEYLNDPAAENYALKQLAKGIIHNQKFEIGLLAELRGTVSKASTDPDAPAQKVAKEGRAQTEKFFRSAIPGPLDNRIQPKAVSARDVLFAKAMSIHHRAAVDMARAYLRNPHVNNPYLELFCIDIVRDQSLEIAYMQSVIDKYEGDAAAIAVPRSMVHGMAHMGGMAHAGHAMPESVMSESAMSEHGMIEHPLTPEPATAGPPMATHAPSHTPAHGAGH